MHNSNDHDTDTQTTTAMDDHDDSSQRSDDDESESSDSSDKKPTVTLEEQNRLLEQVRESIPDDVPFLVLGHVHCPISSTTRIRTTPSNSAKTGDSSSSATTATSSRSNTAKNSNNHTNIARTDVPYSLSTLLPHYHNPTQVFYYANARTGQGIKSAMDWLVTLARRQQSLRQQRSSAAAAVAEAEVLTK